MWKFISIRLLVLFFFIFFPFNSFSDEKSWNLLKEGGKIIMIRHSLADQLPDGTPISGGDADGFTLGSCEKQRVLGKTGINQSIRMGEEFRKRKIKIHKVLSRQSAGRPPIEGQSPMSPPRPWKTKAPKIRARRFRRSIQRFAPLKPSATKSIRP